MAAMECSRSELQECIACIKRVLPDFDADCSTDRELCEILQDGEILCSLLVTLSNGQIQLDSSNSIVLSRMNLELFLKQCREVLRMEERDLFEPDDLLALANPARVVRAVTKLVASFSSTKATEDAKPCRTSGLVIDNVVNEICEHEKQLVDKMEALLKYRNELRGPLSDWPPELVQSVFQHTEPLLALHRGLWTRLAGIAEHGAEAFCLQLGPVFAEMEPSLNIYVDYLSNSATAHFLLSEVDKKKELARQLEMLDKYFGSPGFHVLYYAPIKQTTNYKLLYKRLQTTAQKELPTKFSEAVGGAITLVDNFLERLNTCKKQAEQLAVTKKVLAQVTNLPLEFSKPEQIGLHSVDDSFKVRVPKEAEPQQCLCVLTTKQLILAKESKKDAKAAYWFSIAISSSLQVRKADQRILELTLNGGLKWLLEVPKLKSRGLEKWVQLITDARATNFPNGWNSSGHRFELRSFPEGTSCSKCKSALSGMVLQGYGCDHCRQQLHLLCLPQMVRRGSAPSLPTARGAASFYHGALNRVKATELLAKRAPGTFLLRDSTQGGWALSMMTGTGVVHFNVEQAGGLFSLGQSGCSFDSVDNLIEFYRGNSMSVHFSGVNCRLGDGVPCSAVTGAGRLRFQSAIVEDA